MPAVLDTVDLITPDELTGEIEVSYGKKQVVVVHRTLVLVRRCCKIIARILSDSF